MVPSALSVKAASQYKEDAACFAKIDGAIERVRKALDGLDKVLSDQHCNGGMQAVENGRSWPLL